MREKGIDKYANITSSTAYTVHKRSCRNRILEKAKPERSTSRSRLACEMNSRGVKFPVVSKVANTCVRRITNKQIIVVYDK